MQHYQHLTKEERFYIWNELRHGKTQKAVADALGRSSSTICREIKRNKYPQRKIYTYEWALQIVRFRKRWNAQTKARKITKKVGQLVESLIRQYLSPEQVSGYLARHKGLSISHETIYRYIYADKNRHQQLKPFLRQGYKVRRKSMVQALEPLKYPIERVLRIGRLL